MDIIQRYIHSMITVMSFSISAHKIFLDIAPRTCVLNMHTGQIIASFQVGQFRSFPTCPLCYPVKRHKKFFQNI